MSEDGLEASMSDNKQKVSPIMFATVWSPHHGRRYVEVKVLPGDTYPLYIGVCSKRKQIPAKVTLWNRSVQ